MPLRNGQRATHASSGSVCNVVRRHFVVAATIFTMLALGPTLVTGGRQDSKADALATMTANDPTLLAYFGEKPFRDHSSVKWLLTTLNMSYPGLEKVASAAEEGSEFKVRFIYFLLPPPHVLPPSTSSSAARFECYARCALVFLASTNCFYYF